MTKETLLMCREILLKLNYGTECYTPSGSMDMSFIIVEGKTVLVNPFTDSCEGRKQLEFIEDWVESNPDIWSMVSEFRPFIYDIGEKYSQWRVERIEYCMNRLLRGGEE